MAYGMVHICFKKKLAHIVQYSAFTHHATPQIEENQKQANRITDMAKEIEQRDIEMEKLRARRKNSTGFDSPRDREDEYRRQGADEEEEDKTGEYDNAFEAADTAVGRSEVTRQLADARARAANLEVRDTLQKP